ncbi:AfsR/SARP family transcriptional regulator [Amycolatopsis anabasis]|uniref:AfsR/SARP family transcriptional regulator n=1 Tax=Amycolatopsis anabasis TaxID=1840409 RepID=UPI00131C5F9A|nr:AfsR/SARP family transcriptional regulator [Amycolatopsis anabasis]
MESSIHRFVPQLRFELLGPLSVKYSDVDITPSAPKLRTLLCLLLINSNRVVTVSTLLDGLWEGEAPSSARNTLQTYVFQLRKLFERALGVSSAYISDKLLITYSGGYLLRVRPDQFDVFEFERLVAMGSSALAEGQHGRAAMHLTRALDLWRGPMTFEGAQSDHVRASLNRLEERRFFALIQRIEADLCRGLHQELVSELSSLVIEYPLEESVHAMSMVALHRSGRTPGALGVFRQLDSRMKEELGIEPSSRLQALHRALLSADPQLSEPRHRLGTLLDSLAITW